MWTEPTRDGSLSEEVAAWTRHTRFELVHRLSLPFATHHPQGMALAAGRIFLTTVEVLEPPQSLPGADGDPSRRTPGRGRGHVLVIEPDGTLAADVLVGDAECYHPSGIDFTGGMLWVPVGEYRSHSRSIIYTLDPVTLDLVERFEVDDHITWLVPAADEDALYGASWGSRRLYRWGLSEDADGQLSAGHPEAWENPSWHLDFQEAQYDGGGRLICAGISELPDPDGGKYELGGVAVVHFGERRLVADVPVPLFSAAGHTVFRNPFLLTRDRSEVLLHVAPDDGDELNGTEILTYRVRHESGPPSRSGRLRTFARCEPAAQ